MSHFVVVTVGVFVSLNREFSRGSGVQWLVPEVTMETDQKKKNVHARLKVTSSHHAREFYICEIYFFNNVTVRL